MGHSLCLGAMLSLVAGRTADSRYTASVLIDFWFLSSFLLPLQSSNVQDASSTHMEAPGLAGLGLVAVSLTEKFLQWSLGFFTAGYLS